jgi:hypothetical protein
MVDLAVHKGSLIAGEGDLEALFDKDTDWFC